MHSKHLLGHSKHSILIIILLLGNIYTKANVFSRSTCLRDSNAWSINLRSPESKLPFFNHSLIYHSLIR